MQAYIQKNLPIILFIIAAILLQLFPSFSIIFLLVLFYDMIHSIYGEKYIRITISYRHKYDTTTVFYHSMGFKITENNQYPTHHNINERFRKEKEVNTDSNIKDIQLFSYEELCKKSADLISTLEKNDHFFKTIEN